MAPHTQNKPSWVCGTPEEVPGLDEAQSPQVALHLFPLCSSPQGFGALESFLHFRELSLPGREGQITQTGAGFCSCSLLLNSIFLSVFDCVFLPHLLLLYMICQYWVSSHCTLLSLNIYSSSLIAPPFTTAFSSGLV